MYLDFVENLRKREAHCRNLQLQADAVFRQNGFKSNEDQCRLLQMAADLEADMAEMTMGEERAHHEREKSRLDYEIMKIRSEIEPRQTYSGGGSSGASGTAAPAGAKGKPTPNANGAKDNGAKTKDEEALDRTARTWFKDAPRHSFEDVSGMVELKKRLQTCVTDSKSEDLLDFLKIPRLNSYFFVGPPGCGKTYIIEAFAHELMDQDYKYLSLEGSDIISRYVGDAEKIVTRLFEEAEKNAPCIVFIDEIDSVCKNRSLPNLPEYAANITTSFLTGYNRINSSDSKVIFIGATNYPKRVDEAMFDRVEVINVPLPDEGARANAFARQFKKVVQLEDGFTFDEMAQMVTDDYNYRDINRLSTEVKRSMFKELMEQYKDQVVAIEVLKSGAYKLTRAKFESILSGFRPFLKDDILKEIAEWEERYNQSQQE